MISLSVAEEISSEDKTGAEGSKLGLLFGAECLTSHRGAGAHAASLCQPRNGECHASAPKGDFQTEHQ